MLSRTASSLYWIGRHIERADFVARLIEAALQFELLPQARGGDDWGSAVSSSGAMDRFATSGQVINRTNVIAFLAFDQDNPGSIMSCMELARNDARAIRTAITRECFETLNEAHLAMKTHVRRGKTGDIQGFIDWIKTVTRGFEGAMHRTMLRNDSLWFLRLGSAIERADNTARLLDVKYHCLLPQGEEVGGTHDQAQWTALLRSVSAVTAYRWIYRDGLKPWLVADLMILRREMPRSLAACVDEAAAMLACLRADGGRTGAADRQIRKIQTSLAKLPIDDVIKSGLHEFLQEFLADNNQLGRAVSDQFLF
nr:alpha-E domain-containing protein [Aquisediminimonas sediminicola]